MRSKLIWMLSSKAEFTRYSIDRLQEEAQAMNIRLLVFKPEELSFFIKGIDRLLIKDSSGVELELPDALYVKMGCSTVGSRGLALLQAVENFGRIPVTNPSKTYQCLGNKWDAYVHCLKTELPVPKTIRVSQPSDLALAVEAFKFPFVAKEIHGARGDSVQLIHTQEEAARFFENHSSDQSLNGPQYIAQQYVPSSHGKDVRLLVVGGKALGAIERKAPEGGFLANVSQGGSVRPVELTDSMKAVAIRCREKFGLMYGGIDLLYAENEMLVCEFNLGAQFLGFEKATGFNVAGAVLNSLVEPGKFPL